MKNLDEVVTGRIPLDLLEDPNVTLDIVRVFAWMDYMGPIARRNMYPDELARLIGISGERLQNAVDFLIEYEWEKLVPGRKLDK